MVKVWYSYSMSFAEDVLQYIMKHYNFISYEAAPHKAVFTFTTAAGLKVHMAAEGITEKYKALKDAEYKQLQQAYKSATIGPNPPQMAVKWDSYAPEKTKWYINSSQFTLTNPSKLGMITGITDDPAPPSKPRPKPKSMRDLYATAQQPEAQKPPSAPYGTTGAGKPDLMVAHPKTWEAYDALVKPLPKGMTQNQYIASKFIEPSEKVQQSNPAPTEKPSLEDCFKDSPLLKYLK